MRKNADMEGHRGSGFQRSRRSQSPIDSGLYLSFSTYQCHVDKALPTLALGDSYFFVIHPVSNLERCSTVAIFYVVDAPTSILESLLRVGASPPLLA